ncbi:MAG TPA: hypothetical protein VL282_19395 [Tepidisphaeraceae bacterium]|nr:hypothetical protein [Tepidisphaeraceae bacterium]
MESEQVQRAMLEKFGIRVQPEMIKYILAQLKQSASAEIPVMGSYARTGVPVRQHISLAALQQTSPAVSSGA